MGIREKLEQRGPLVGIGAAVVLVGSVVAIIVQARNLQSFNAGDAYFSTDDGQTFFVDTGAKLPPFEVDGKQAVKAHVFMCGGKRVVGYLSRYTPETLKAIEDAKAARDQGKPPPNVHLLAGMGTTGLEVKRPGPNNPWVKQADVNRATRIRVFRCPDGSIPAEVGPE